MRKKVKIFLQPNEQYCIIDKTATALIFTDDPRDCNKAKIDILLPNEEDVKDKIISPSINMATAIAAKIQVDPTFANEIASWFMDHCATASARNSNIIEQSQLEG